MHTIYDLTGHIGKHTQLTHYIPVYTIYDLTGHIGKHTQLTCYIPVYTIYDLTGHIGKHTQLTHYIPVHTIYDLTGHIGKHTQLTHIPVHTIYDALITEHRTILLSVYCLPGCDTVGVFFGHGKHTAFRIMMQKADQFQLLALLGSDEECILKEVEMASTKFVGNIYGKTNCTSLNALRC